METMQQQRPNPFPHHQSLPPIASLTSDLPPPPEPSPGLPRQVLETRDSGNWSSSHQSKHSSFGSTGLQLHSILNAEDSPSRSSMVSEGPYSVRTSLNPSLHSSHLLDNRQSADVSSLQESRRSSVDSRMNSGFRSLAIGATSPYEGQNPSRSSLVSNLQQQRGIGGEQRLSSGPLSPLGPRNGSRVHVPPRQAPVIMDMRSKSGMNPTAAAPTKGQPWAFPDFAEPDDGRDSTSGESTQDRVPSRANSYAPSFNSSIFTADSQLPAGQKRFDEDSVSTSTTTTHHHPLQHASVTSLQATSVNGGSGNYSRTPELRINHKMAERKRRSEMKNLFDELNVILPNSPGGKSSKWEVLTRAIDHIKALRHANENARRDADRLKMDGEVARRYDEENRVLKAELETMWQHMRRVDPGKAHVFGQYTTQLEREQTYQPQPTHNGMISMHQSQPSTQQQPSAPPSQQLQQPPPPQHHTQNGWSQHSAAPMQGVEYGPGQVYGSR